MGTISTIVLPDDTGSIDTQKYLPLEGDLFGKQSQP